MKGILYVVIALGSHICGFTLKLPLPSLSVKPALKSCDCACLLALGVRYFRRRSTKKSDEKAPSSS